MPCSLRSISQPINRWRPCSLRSISQPINRWRKQRTFSDPL
ncbi:hypothetical protein Patl1_00331 [Pistacia atlantica]|uniref:Uncharacterized protein n=1 Tax=Pistacia atlantica TaxID=434234 RepID=A0ACC1CD47_9ROSI|nr:hypothetical protein Patl1_00331 [Pistacia atlantica]